MGEMVSQREDQQVTFFLKLKADQPTQDRLQRAYLKLHQIFQIDPPDLGLLVPQIVLATAKEPTDQMVKEVESRSSIARQSLAFEVVFCSVTLFTWSPSFNYYIPYHIAELVEK